MTIYQQTDSQNFHIGQVAELAPGAIDAPKPVYDKTTHRARWADNDWDIRTHAEWDEVLNPPPPPPSAEELRAQSMLTGEDYGGYQVSFTADDGNGMLQVKAGFELGLTETVIHFKNGTKMPILATEFPAFAAWFVQQRNGYFV